MRNQDVPGPDPCTGPCGRSLPRTVEFYARDAMSPCGLRRRCRDCRAEEERERYRLNAVAILQRRREARVQRAAYWETTDHWNAA
ncbi:hypothetical protein [Streptomyces griseus]|uniref:hypothetical protein n=1 Tax=Streptomyces griseus TaxID=1911 RepID=UPI003794FA48